MTGGRGRQARMPRRDRSRVTAARLHLKRLASTWSGQVRTAPRSLAARPSDGGATRTVGRRAFGAYYYGRLHPTGVTRYLVRRLEGLGYRVMLQPA
jgi:hypothetical protein